MAWSDQIFAYCERGLDPGFWAEPLNAVSNAAFLFASGAAALHWRNKPKDECGGCELALAGLVGVIGIGSFLFHTLATRWAQVADVLPIGVFMLVYLVYALRRLVGLGWIATGIGLAVFGVALLGAEGMQCGGAPCLNGSAGYLPALVALAVIGAWLTTSRHAGGRLVLGAAGLFAISLTMRTFDRTLCQATMIGDRHIGLHFLWHTLNAMLLYLLLVAAIEHGRRRPGLRG